MAVADIRLVRSRSVMLVPEERATLRRVSSTYTPGDIDVVQQYPFPFSFPFTFSILYFLFTLCCDLVWLLSRCHCQT